MLISTIFQYFTCTRPVDIENVEATPHRHRFLPTQPASNISKETSNYSATLSSLDYSTDYSDGSYISHKVTPSSGETESCLTASYKSWPLRYHPCVAEVACRLDFESVTTSKSVIDPTNDPSVPDSVKNEPHINVAMSPTSASFSEELSDVITSYVATFLGDELDTDVTDPDIPNTEKSSRRLSTGSTDSGFSSEVSVRSDVGFQRSGRKISTTFSSVINSSKLRHKMSRLPTVGQSPIRRRGNSYHTIALL